MATANCRYSTADAKQYYIPSRNYKWHTLVKIRTPSRWPLFINGTFPLSHIDKRCHSISIWLHGVLNIYWVANRYTCKQKHTLVWWMHVKSLPDQFKSEFVHGAWCTVVHSEYQLCRYLTVLAGGSVCDWNVPTDTSMVSQLMQAKYINVALDHAECNTVSVFSLPLQYYFYLSIRSLLIH